MRYVGQSIPRVDGRDKVTGRLTYMADLAMPTAAHVTILTSPLPHAKIVSLETARAERLTGVYGVLTQRDLLSGRIPFYHYGPALRDQPILAVHKVRFVGEPVAAVAAVDADTAQEALQLIDVEYRELPTVLNPDEALSEGAPRVHESLEHTAAFADLKGLHPTAERNIANRFEFKVGDVDRGLHDSAYVFEETYDCAAIQGYPLEPHCCIAQVDPSGNITLWTTSQTFFFVRSEIARMFGLPVNRVRVLVLSLGGGFGSKGYLKLEPLAVALSQKTGVPVRINMSQEQVFVNSHSRHAAEVRLRVGVSKDRRLTAGDCEIVWDTGAYADVGPRVAQKAGLTALGPYRFPHIAIRSTAVFTNKIPAGAFRGYGVNQTAWALESHMDSISHELGIDPLEFRLRNLVSGSGHYSREAELAKSVHACLKEVAEKIDWSAPVESGQGPVKRGRGIACSIKATVTPSLSQAAIKLHEDGSLTLLVGTVEIGQGSSTILSQIVAESLGVPIEHISLAHIDTDTLPYDQVTGSSRSTYAMGNALLKAVEDLKQQIQTIGADMFNARASDILVEDGCVRVAGRPNSARTLAEAAQFHFRMRGGALVGKGELHTGKVPELTADSNTVVSAFWAVTAGAAEVQVDTDTGAIRVLRYVSATDAGKAINPLCSTGQIEGSAMMAVGHALFENLVWENGQPLNCSLMDYALPLMEHMPEFTTQLVEIPDPQGPFGAKGLGEAGIPAVAPAIGNAVFKATGVRVASMPLTPDMVLRALGVLGKEQG